MKFNDSAANAKYWSEKKLLKHIKEFEEMFNKNSREFVKEFTEHDYMNFKGKCEERNWYYYIKVLVMRNKEKIA